MVYALRYSLINQNFPTDIVPIIAKLQSQSLIHNLWYKPSILQKVPCPKFGHQTMNLDNIRSSFSQTILAATRALVHIIVMSMTSHLCHGAAWAPEKRATIAKAAPCDLKCFSHTHARYSPDVNEVYREQRRDDGQESWKSIILHSNRVVTAIRIANLDCCSCQCRYHRIDNWVGNPKSRHNGKCFRDISSGFCYCVQFQASHDLS